MEGFNDLCQKSYVERLFPFHLCTGIMLDKSKESTPPLEAVLEPELIDAISKLLNDRNSQVKVAAAITLYSLNKPSEKVINE